MVGNRCQASPIALWEMLSFQSVVLCVTGTKYVKNVPCFSYTYIYICGKFVVKNIMFFSGDQCTVHSSHVNDVTLGVKKIICTPFISTFHSY